MSLQLWFDSFDWDRFHSLLRESPDYLAELICTDVTDERAFAAAKKLKSDYNMLPESDAELSHAIQRMLDADDWYACFEQDCWPSLDSLLSETFSCHGWLGAEPRTNGVRIDTYAAAYFPYPRHLRSETYRMGHRRFRHEGSPVHADETYDDPGYSIHTSEQVEWILSEISEFDYNSYPDEGVRRNFREDFLEPIRLCREKGLAIFSHKG